MTHVEPAGRWWCSRTTRI